MPATLPLLKREITYSEARKEEVNILHRLQYYNQRNEFFTNLCSHGDWIKAVVTHHLGLQSTDLCQVADVEDWLHGSFNVCIPITINEKGSQKLPGTRVLLRLPLPYRTGEEFRPGNSDEKIRCEAGTYAWIQENCPEVPIPQLYGFATSDGQTLTYLESLPFFKRCLTYLHRFILSYLGKPVPSLFVPHTLTMLNHKSNAFPSGYLLLEYIESTKGQMLSSTWFERHDDSQRRQTLFRDLSRILLSLARVPLPSIGSFLIDRDGYLQLTNRPLSLEIQDLENEKIPMNMSRCETYSTVSSYIVDLLGNHNNRIVNQPNAINNTGDYVYQVSALTTMQAIFPSLFRREFSRGPFTFTLTDMHQSNIFVDDHWHITSLVDLEWACSRPIEMLRTPTWLTNQACDEIAEDPSEYDIVRSEFINIMSNEEKLMGVTSEKSSLSEIMNQNWETGTFWFSLGLASPTGLFSVFYKQIQPRFMDFCSSHHSTDNYENFLEIMPWYWSKDLIRIAARKKKDRKVYDDQLKAAFGILEE